MTIQATITHTGFAAHMTSKGNFTREFERIRKAALMTTGRYWRRHFLPRHFTQRAYSRYQIDARSYKYDKRKKKRFGHTKPLVYTGESVGRILADRKPPRVRRRDGLIGVEVRIHGPKHFFQYNKHDMDAKVKYDEVRAITQQEAQTLAEVLGTAIDKGIKRSKGRVRRKVA